MANNDNKNNGNTFIQSELIKLNRDLAEIKVTIDKSFESFESTLSSASSLIDSLGKQAATNTTDIVKIKRDIRFLYDEQKKIKKELENKITMIEKKLNLFAKKINWKKVSKIILLVSALIGAIAGIFNHIHKIKMMLFK